MLTMSYANLGNLLHCVSLISTLIYTVLVLRFANTESGIFDQEWVINGFCLTNEDIPYWSSHDLCLYYDSVLCFLGWGVYQKLRNSHPQMKNADDSLKFNLLGHLGHGILHGFIAYLQYRDPNRSERMPGIRNYETVFQMDVLPQIIGVFLFPAFWFGLLKGVLPKVSDKNLVMLSLLVSVGQMPFKANQNFMYVQSILVVCFTVASLQLPQIEKNFDYFAMAFAGMIISFVPWIECMACESIASKVGGHLIFDASIPISLVSAYVASWLHFNSTEKYHKDAAAKAKKVH
mmetsp:Transcript_296/g.369  ORF Transcript_296/g.369 Transcript_296/m.369 type:complete len:290 (-) Transcript_296:380-1249(-)